MGFVLIVKDINIKLTGDFEEIFDNPEQDGQWNAILTCFFIDTVSNLLSFGSVFIQ